MTTNYDAELEAINKAILAVIKGGTDVSYNGRRVVRSQLPELYKVRDKIEGEIARGGCGPRVRQAKFGD